MTNKTKIYGEMNLVVSVEANDVQDTVAKFDENIIKSIHMSVTLMDGSSTIIKVEDHSIQWSPDEN